jgi:hypothetical protein
VLALSFMIIGAIAEKPAVYIALGAVWLVVGIGIMAKNKKQSSPDQPDKTA